MTREEEGMLFGGLLFRQRWFYIVVTWYLSCLFVGILLISFLSLILKMAC